MTRRGAGIFVLGVALAAPARAQQAGKIGEVVLFGEEDLKIQSATKTDVPLSQAPSSVTVITARQIRESGALTLADLLRLVAGVNVRWNPMVATIDVRGFGESPFTSRLLILVDGVPINSPDTGGFPLSPSFDVFPLENVKRVEVVRGPGSSLYGENAFWGVVSIVTYSGEDLDGARVDVLGGDRHTLWGGVQWGQKLGDVSLLGSFRALRSQMPTKFWTDADSDIKGTDIYLKASHKGLTASYYRHDERMDGFREDFGEAGFPPGSVFASADPLKQTVQIASLRYETPKGKPFSFSADLGYSHRDGMHCAGCHASRQLPEYQKRADHGYQLIGDFRLGIHVLPSHDILVGVEGRKLDAADHQDELSPGAVVAQGYEKLAAYFQDQVTLFGGKARLVAGLRYDAETDLFDDRFSPRLSLVVNPTRRLVLRAGWSTAFRFPNTSELYQNSAFLMVHNEQLPIPPIPLAVFTPNPGLQPEEIRTFDVGGEVQITSALAAKLDLYHSRVKRFMVITPLLAPPPATPGLQVQNHPDIARITGGELELRANVTNTITGYASYAYQEGDQKGRLTDSSNAGIEFVYAPKHKINVGAYAGPFAGVRAAAELSWRDRYVAPAFWYLVTSNFTDPTIRPLPSYTLLNSHLSWDVPIEVRGRQPFRLSLYVNNILDETPRETLIGVDTSLTGREVFGRLEVRF